MSRNARKTGLLCAASAAALAFIASAHGAPLTPPVLGDFGDFEGTRPGAHSNQPHKRLDGSIVVAPPGPRPHDPPGSGDSSLRVPVGPDGGTPIEPDDDPFGDQGGRDLTDLIGGSDPVTPDDYVHLPDGLFGDDGFVNPSGPGKNPRTADLSPVPAPSSLALLGTASLLAVRRRRR